MMYLVSIIVLFVQLSNVSGFLISSQRSCSNSIKSLNMAIDSSKLMNKVLSITIGLSCLVNTALAADFEPAPWDNTVQYQVLKKSGKDVKPIPGEMVTVRFKGSYKGFVFDDIFNTPEPYYYRAGVGSILKGK